MSEEEVEELLIRYQEKRCTAAEMDLVEQWYAQWNSDMPLSISPEELQADLLSMAQNNRHFIEKNNRQSGKVIRWSGSGFYKIGMAAALAILVFGMGFYVYKNQFKNASAMYDVVDIDPKYDITAGANGATLTLSNGRKILLTDAVTGQLAEESGTSISKTADGRLMYTLKNADPENGASGNYNTLSTSNGQQYVVVLPDQSKVWLNASSSIKFPSTFIGSKDRMIELNGEAYFEVFKDSKHPFVVKTNSQRVQVLGTHFNVNAYADEGNTRTSLLEGSIRISSIQSGEGIKSHILRPGQQATLMGNAIDITDADVEQSIDWKNSEFVFNNEALESIMRKIARWYDVKVIYQDEQLRQEVFGGTISRFKNVSKVLGMLEMTGSVHFKIQGRRIIVTK